MRNIKRCLILLLIPMLLLALLAGCGGKADYPVITPMDTGSVTLETVQNDTLQVSYPAGTWLGQANSAPLTLMYADTYGTDSAVNINIQSAAEFEGTLTEKDMEQLVGELEENQGYITVDLTEMRLLREEPVIYMESTLQFTDAYLDQLISAGALTEEVLDSMGGREVILNMPATKQITLYAVAEGHLYILVGTYFDPAHRQELLDAMTVMIDTVSPL